MTKRLGWIGVLSLVCAGVSAGPMVEAQKGPNHDAGANGRAAQPQSMGHSPGPKTAAPKGEANNRGQHPGASAPASPAGLAASPAGAAQPHPSGGVSTQTPPASQTQSPFSDSFIVPNQGVKTPVSPSGPGAQTQPPANGTSGTNPQSPTPSQNPTTVQNQTTAPFSEEELTPPPGRKPPKEGTPKQLTTPNTQNSNQKPQPKVQPSPTQGYPPLGPPQPPLPLPPSPNGLLTLGHNPLYSPGALDQAQPSVTNSTSNGSPEKAPIEKEQTAPTTPQNNPTPEASAQSQGGDAGKVTETQNPTPHPPPPPPPPPPVQPPVLNLSPSPHRPAVGTTVVVTAKLNPPQAMKNYELNWGDGSPVETVSESATHRYTKANTYKVSARTIAGDKELNREIMLPVVVWPWVTVSLASVAGVGFLSLHMLVNLTTGCRWDTPKMTFVGRQPYVSLSFVPDVGPAEERITILDKKRRSG
jgi:hypothetical protein